MKAAWAGRAEEGSCAGPQKPVCVFKTPSVRFFCLFVSNENVNLQAGRHRRNTSQGGTVQNLGGQTWQGRVSHWAYVLWASTNCLPFCQMGVARKAGREKRSSFSKKRKKLDSGKRNDRLAVTAGCGQGCSQASAEPAWRCLAGKVLRSHQTSPFPLSDLPKQPGRSCTDSRRCYGGTPATERTFSRDQQAQSWPTETPPGHRPLPPADAFIRMTRSLMSQC